MEDKQNVVKINILLLNGQKVQYSFEEETKVENIKQHLIENWPIEWPIQTPVDINALRFLYLGKIMEDSKSLKELKILNGNISTFHLTILSKQQIEDNIKSKSTKSKPSCFPCLCL